MARYIRNISYFCIMKRLYEFLTVLCLLFALPLMPSVKAQTIYGENDLMAAWDSVHISLITCSPHDEVYSLYGHSGLRVEDRRTGQDVVVNYGMFSFGKPFFVLRFVMGLTDYEVWPVPYERFMAEYEYYGCEVTQQELNLQPEEKKQLMQALAKNCTPEERVYRYNFLYNNCTTRVRDIVCENINGKVAYNLSVPDGLTLRHMLAWQTAGHEWAELGNDLILGMKADRIVSLSEMQFLPHIMLQSLDSASIMRKGEHAQPLVLEKRILAKATPETVDADSNMQSVEKQIADIMSPNVCSIILLSIVSILTYVERKRRKYYWPMDALLLILTGLGGIILTAMLFSQHPTVNENIQLLVLNPLTLVFGVQAMRRRVKRNKHWLWGVMMMMACLMIVLYSFGVQHINTAVLLLTIALIIRYAANYVIKYE